MNNRALKPIHSWNNNLLVVTPEEIERRYLIFSKGQTLRNNIIKLFMYNKGKDIDGKGKLKKNLGICYSFNDIDVMGTYSFPEFFSELQTNRFVKEMFPAGSTMQFLAIRNSVNKIVDQTLWSTRGFFHRRYGMRPYKLCEYVVNGVPHDEIMLVPTLTDSVDNFKKHPAYSRENLIHLADRTKRAMANITTFENKLRTFRKELAKTSKKMDLELKSA